MIFSIYKKKKFHPAFLLYINMNQLLIDIKYDFICMRNFMSNAIGTNYFTIFLQIVDMTNS